WSVPLPRSRSPAHCWLALPVVRCFSSSWVACWRRRRRRSKCWCPWALQPGLCRGASCVPWCVVCAVVRRVCSVQCVSSSVSSSHLPRSLSLSLSLSFSFSFRFLFLFFLASASAAAAVAPFLQLDVAPRRSLEAVTALSLSPPLDLSLLPSPSAAAPAPLLSV